MFETVAKRDSNPGSLDCESGILPLSYGAPLYPVSISLCHISLSPHVSQRPQLPPYVFLLRNYVLICCSLKKTPHIQLIIFEPTLFYFFESRSPMCSAQQRVASVVCTWLFIFGCQEDGHHLRFLPCIPPLLPPQPLLLPPC